MEGEASREEKPGDVGDPKVHSLGQDGGAEKQASQELGHGRRPPCPPASPPLQHRYAGFLQGPHLQMGIHTLQEEGRL